MRHTRFPATGVSKHAGARPLNLKTDQKRERERREYDERVFDDLWRTLPGKQASANSNPGADRRARLGLPEENLLYFIEKTSPPPAIVGARNRPHRPPDRTIFLPAAAGQGDERRLRHLGASARHAPPA